MHFTSTLTNFNNLTDITLIFSESLENVVILLWHLQATKRKIWVKFGVQNALLFSEIVNQLQSNTISLWLVNCTQANSISVAPRVNTKLRLATVEESILICLLYVFSVSSKIERHSKLISGWRNNSKASTYQKSRKNFSRKRKQQCNKN